ncbi:MAG: hypothetical protein WC378_20680 [Opitutaceae bacterium]|jgi:hypothetical protein
MTPDERVAILKRYGLWTGHVLLRADVVADALAKAETRTPREKAAGELLEAGKAASECLCYCGGDQWPSAQRLRAAIAIAEPKENKPG